MSVEAALVGVSINRGTIQKVPAQRHRFAVRIDLEVSITVDAQNTACYRYAALCLPVVVFEGPHRFLG